MFEQLSPNSSALDPGRFRRGLGLSVATHATALIGLLALRVPERVAPLPGFHVALLAPTPAPTVIRPVIFKPAVKSAVPHELPALPSVEIPVPRQTPRAFEPPTRRPVELPSNAFIAPPPLQPVNDVPVLTVAQSSLRFNDAPAPTLKTDNLSTSPTPVPITQHSALVRTAGFSGAEPAGVLHAKSGNGSVTGAFETRSAPSTQVPAIAAVKAGTFGDASIGRGEHAVRATSSAPVKPVEILFKPKPEYTAEARRSGVEGEVLVEALFSAAGDLRIIRLVRGLGHGLDENALAAARAIRFRPAERAGAAIDSTAIVHILFQLAY